MIKDAIANIARCRTRLKAQPSLKVSRSRQLCGYEPCSRGIPSPLRRGSGVVDVNVLVIHYLGGKAAWAVCGFWQPIDLRIHVRGAEDLAKTGLRSEAGLVRKTSKHSRIRRKFVAEGLRIGLMLRRRL